MSPVTCVQVWLFTMVPVAEQVPQLLRDKQFELVGPSYPWSILALVQLS